MLESFIEINGLPNGVNMPAALPMYRLVDPGLLRTLMRRTGTGAPITVRGLAEAAGCSRSTVGNLLAEQQSSVPAVTAHAIAQGIGVDVLILFTPVGRASTAARPSLAPAVPEGAAA
ncbi:helix-turn-helix domain-containing protein [Streptomyces gamaensis]|uniref:Helix-turn-helix domain-containing protein n=1 Tax=Streptomyces gamaensis TaxID=1763542 RepID=A0ABW0YX70_9ACTN